MKQSIRFTKMHGLGNCYIYLDLFRDAIDNIDFSHLAQQVADPYTGIGSDGLILITPSDRADLMMRMFNKDGSEGKNCGNGLRCVAKYAYENRLVREARFSIETLGGTFWAEVHSKNGHVDLVTIDMGIPKLSRGDVPMTGRSEETAINENVHLIDGEWRVTALSIGNPQAIFFVDAIEAAPLDTIGPLLADGHPLFPDGVNVGFVQVIGSNALTYRVWERGSGPTRACGTGATAAVVAAVLNHYSKQNEEVTVHLPGGDLNIKWDEASGHVFKTGPAETICDGVLYY
ncbi:diaminopimelate epimerase [Camelliibacillus cellulosilyticus]|uniref:Diaminopimelate epimerase n=1 Tax=Camelliibacillus cellulosilyticus TaxID=2174486 RepID=A0ABV9GJB5_9BACL